MNIEVGQIGIILTVVFSAGIIWNKVNVLEKKIDRFEDHAERITVVETKLEIKKSNG